MGLTRPDGPRRQGDGENFPVGSWLIRADLRAAVHAFYAFARAADDVADDGARPSSDRLARLDGFEAGLDGEAWGAAEGLRLRVAAPVGVEPARRLLRAFRTDARRDEVRSWDDLLAYCRDSADPVGRFLLALHGEGGAAQGPSDALCTVLQVLNHLQDQGDDERAMRRCYLPAEWLEELGARRADLLGRALTPALRRVTDRALDRCDALIVEAGRLPGLLRSRRLAAESAAIVALARALAARLRREDPLARRVRLGRRDRLRAGGAALGALLAPRGRPLAVGDAA